MCEVRIALPPSLVEAAEREGRQAWLTTLPETLRVLEERWSLTVGPPFDPGGQASWAAPARGRLGEDLVLKLGWRHPEAAHEADGLRAWNGNGSVRLHAAEELDETLALLLERCRPGTSLAARPEPEQDVVIAGLLERLWLVPPPGHRFRPLQVMCDQWADGFLARYQPGPASLDGGLVRAGIELFRALPGTADQAVLLCTDLHAGNVLAAVREPWLMIDPKPYLGDPAYDPLQHMLNCERRLVDDPRGLAGRMAGLLGLDAERLLLWLFARCVQESPGRPALARVARAVAPT